MKLYVTILKGDTAHTAEPIIVTSDDELLTQIAELIKRRISPAEHPKTANGTATDSLQAKTQGRADQ